MTNMTKEEIYNNEVYFLMSKIIEVCQANDIAMFAHFQLDDTEDGGQDLCTTALPVGTDRDKEMIKLLSQTATQEGSTSLLVTMSKVMRDG